MQCVVLFIKISSRFSSQKTVSNTAYMTNIYHSGTNKNIFIHSTPLSDFLKAYHSLTAWHPTPTNTLINDHSVYVQLSSPWQGTPLKTLKHAEMPSVLAFLRSRLPQGLSQRKIFLYRRHTTDILRRTVRDCGLKAPKNLRIQKMFFFFGTSAKVTGVFEVERMV